MGLTSKLCVITGGPGTGKTSVQRALLDLYKKRFPAARIVCCAPTGKAARRIVFIAALFIIARTWKQPRCPSAEEWIRELWYIYAMDYYSAMKRNAFDQF